jgi:hypothetical protein
LHEIFAVQENLTGGGLQQARETSNERRLPASRQSHQDEFLSVADFE